MEGAVQVTMRNVVARFAALLALLLLVAAPVSAEAPPDHANNSPCAPGQPPDRPPNRPPDNDPPGQDEPPGQPPDRPPPDRPPDRQYPPSECGQQVSRSNAGGGESIRAYGTGFAPASKVTLALNGETIKTVAAPDGSFLADVTIPKQARVGPAKLTSTGTDAAGGSRVLSAQLVVADSDAARGRSAPADDALPVSAAATAGLGAIALIAFGTVAVAAARRRREHT